MLRRVDSDDLGHGLRTTKYLSEKSHVEQDVSSGEVDEGQPVLWLLAPPDTNAAAFAKPAQSSFHHPSSSGIGFLAWRRAHF